MKKINQVQENYDIDMFTEKKLSRDRSPATLDALALHLRRTLIFFLNYFTTFTKNKVYDIEKTFSLHKQLHPV